MMNKLTMVLALSAAGIASLVGSPAVSWAGTTPGGQMYVQSRTLTYEQEGKTFTERATYAHGTENFIAYVLPGYQLVGDVIKSTHAPDVTLQISELSTSRFRKAQVSARKELVYNGHILGGTTRDSKFPPHAIVLYNTNRTTKITDMFVFTEMGDRHMEFHMYYPAVWKSNGALGAMMNAVIVPSVPNKY